VAALSSVCDVLVQLRLTKNWKKLFDRQWRQLRSTADALSAAAVPQVDDDVDVCTSTYTTTRPALQSKRSRPGIEWFGWTFSRSTTAIVRQTHPSTTQRDAISLLSPP